MKLYLSSYRVPVPQAMLDLLPRPATECTAALIPNAKDYSLPNERAESIDDWIVTLGGWGFRCEVVDLRDYEDTNQLKAKLQTFPLVWGLGGNTFILRSEMKRTGLDTFLKELIDNGMIYCGESAGAIVVGTTLEGTEVADEPELADEVIMDGLGIIDKIIVPHADSLDFCEYSIHMKQKHQDDDKVVFINDNQALVVDGDQQKIVSATG